MPDLDPGPRWWDLVCPKDRAPLTELAGGLSCARGHHFPIVAGIPILLDPARPATHWFARGSLHLAGMEEQPPESWLPASVSDHERRLIRDGLDLDVETSVTDDESVDPFVRHEIFSTHGYLYRDRVERLTRHPIPTMRLPPGGGRRLLDVGASWGRWSIAAALLGYRVTAVDPWLAAALAGRRVATRLGVDVRYVVGDARCLPFEDDTFAAGFSYSVLQHLAKTDARDALRELGRVVAPGGTVLVQLPNRWGVRQLHNRIRQVMGSDTSPFRVRYWSPREMRTVAASAIGSDDVRLEIDGFFSLNPQPADLDLLRPRHAAVVRASERLRRLGDAHPSLATVADSLYVRATVSRSGGPADRT